MVKIFPYVVKEVDGHDGALDARVVALRHEHAVAVRQVGHRIKLARPAADEVPVERIGVSFMGDGEIAASGHPVDSFGGPILKKCWAL